MYVQSSTLITLGCNATRADEVARLLNEGLLRYDVSDPDQIAMFVGNLAHESSNFNASRELISAKTANANYGNRMGNVNTGDGYRFRGAGWVQLTGRDNFQGFENYVNANLASFGLTRRVDFTSSDAAADQVGQLPWAAHATFWYKFVLWGTLNRQSLDRHDFLMHCFVTNHPASALKMSQGKPPVLSQPNGWADRERRYNLAKAPIQQDYVAWVRAGSPRGQQTPAGPYVPSIVTTLPPVSTAGAGGFLDDLLGRIFGTKPATPSPTPTPAPASSGDDSWIPANLRLTLPFPTGSQFVGSGSTSPVVAPSATTPTPVTTYVSSPSLSTVAKSQTKTATTKQAEIIEGIPNATLAIGVISMMFALSKPDMKRRKELMR